LLSCHDNQLTKLNIQGCAKLKELNYKNNPLFDEFDANQEFFNSLNLTDYPYLRKNALLNLTLLN